MEAVDFLMVLLAACQALLGLLLMGPHAVALPIAQLLRPQTGKGSARQAVVFTVAAGFAAMLAFSVFQLLQLADNATLENRDTRGDVLATFDKLRAQVSCALSAANLLLLFLLRCLAEHLALYSSSLKNLDAMRRQTKGLQAEYERVTAAPGASLDNGGAVTAALKQQVEELRQQNSALTAAAGVKDKQLASAEIQAKAMESQWKGFEREYDRVMAECQQLQQRLAMVGGGGGNGAGAGGGSYGKKDS